MQRYLGWGIGHRNRADFPHDAHDLVVTDADCETQIQSHDESSSSGPAASHRSGVNTSVSRADAGVQGDAVQEDAEDEEAWQDLIGDQGGEFDPLDERAADEVLGGAEHGYEGDFDEAEYDY